MYDIKQTLKTENTLYKLDIFRHRPICGLFPLKCQSLRQTFQRIIQTLFFAKHLHRFCCWFYFNETKFQNKSRKFFIIAVDFWVLRNRDDFLSYTLSDSVWVNLSENMVRAFIQPIRKAKRLFHGWVERFDQSQRTHQKQLCFR